MINLFLRFALMTILSLFAGCAIIGGIFKAGVWVGILIVVIFIGLIVWLVSRGRSK